MINDSFNFAVTNNVCIVVTDKNNIVQRKMEIHNKATRKMVSGLLRFLVGHFTTSFENDNPDNVVYPDSAKNYIPCYIAFGHGGIESIDMATRTITTSDDWNVSVDYNTDRLVAEFVHNTPNISQVTTRQKIGSSELSIYSESSGDMDSIILSAQLSPSELCTEESKPSGVDLLTPRGITEIALCATNIPKNNDVLAYIKLASNSNLSDDSATDKKPLYVRPDDTVRVVWNVSIISVGYDNTYDNGSQETQPVEPSLGYVNITEIPSENVGE